MTPSPDGFDWTFVDGEIVPSARATVSVRANALNYGTGVFEGIRATWNEERGELYVLEPLDHFRRMARSARIMGLPLAHSPEELVDATLELLRRNEVRQHAYVRPLLVLSADALAVRMHDVDALLSIAITALPGHYIKPGGIRCMVSSWRRAPDDAVPSRAKTTGGYVGPALAKTEAVRAGFDEAILLTAGGHLCEGTTSNVFVRRGAEWVTPPPTDDILEGITRRQVMALIAEELEETVVQRSIDRSELYAADEVMLCGTAVQIAPVVEIDHRPVGDGAVGRRAARLLERLRAIARGDDERHVAWTVPVYSSVPTRATEEQPA